MARTIGRTLSAVLWALGVLWVSIPASSHEGPGNQSWTCIGLNTLVKHTDFVFIKQDVPNLWPIWDQDDGFTIRDDPKKEAAYFDHTWHGINPETKKFQVEYRVTGLTDQVSCTPLADLPCEVPPAQVEELVKKAWQSVDGGEMPDLPLLHVC